jgi:hypothetical protein
LGKIIMEKPTMVKLKLVKLTMSKIIWWN